MLDRNGDGRVSKEELREAMAVLANGVSEADLNEMLQAADEDDDGHISC
jgi:Ca2+-binding EF-hand superfamily protein